MSERGISLEIVYCDPDIVEVVAAVSNDRFSGVASLYTSLAEVADAARTIAGFPAHTGDVREVRLGDAEGGWPGGVLLRFRCVDRLGHVYVESAIHGGDESGNRQQATISIATDAASIDRFVDALSAMGRTGGGRAHLRIAS